jgi:hypothetical protein
MEEEEEEEVYQIYLILLTISNILCTQVRVNKYLAQRYSEFGTFLFLRSKVMKPG